MVALLTARHGGRARRRAGHHPGRGRVAGHPRSPRLRPVRRRARARLGRHLGSDPGPDRRTRPRPGSSCTGSAPACSTPTPSASPGRSATWCAHAPDPVRCVVVDASALSDVDYTAGQVLGRARAPPRPRGVTLVFAAMDHRVRRPTRPLRDGADRAQRRSLFYDRLADAIDRLRGAARLDPRPAGGRPIRSARAPAVLATGTRRPPPPAACRTRSAAARRRGAGRKRAPSAAAGTRPTANGTATDQSMSPISAWVSTVGTVSTVTTTRLVAVASGSESPSASRNNGTSRKPPPLDSSPATKPTPRPDDAHEQPAVAARRTRRGGLGPGLVGRVDRGDRDGEEDAHADQPAAPARTGPAARVPRPSGWPALPAMQAGTAPDERAHGQTRDRPGPSGRRWWPRRPNPAATRAAATPPRPAPAPRAAPAAGWRRRTRPRTARTAGR